MDRVEVRDAETGELIEFLVPGIQSNDSIATAEVPTKTKKKTQSPSDPADCAIAKQSPTRKLGDPVGWTQQQQAKAQRAQIKFRNTIAGVQHEIASATESEAKRELEMELMDKMKTNYYTQVRQLVSEETDREIAREVQLRLESNAIGRSRLEKRFEKERAFYRSQIDRVRDECEMALTAAMATRNFLR